MGLHFEFHGDERPGDMQSKAASAPLAPVVDHEKQTKEALEVDELRVKEDRLRQLAIEDPEEFERQILNGDLTTDDEPEDGDE